MGDLIQHWTQSSKNLSIVGIEFEGLLGTSISADGQKHFSSGAAFLILKDIQFMLNFNFSSIIANDYFPGETVGEAKSGTLAHHLTAGTADLAIGDLYQVRSRLKYGFPLVPINSEKFYAYFVQPTARVSDRIIKTFQPDLLLAFIFILLLIGFVIILVQNLEFEETSNTTAFYKVQIGFLWTFATMAQQEFRLTLAKYKESIRLAAFSGSCLSFIIYLYYSASILSQFLKSSSSVNNFQHLLKLPYTVYSTESVNSTLFHQISKKSSLKYIHVTEIDGFNKIFQLQHIYISTEEVFRLLSISAKVSETKLCSLVSKVIFDDGSIKYGFFARSSFLYRGLFNSKLIKIKSHGLIRRYLKTYKQYHALQCPQRRKHKYDDNLELQELSSAFMSYALVFAVSLIAVTVEHFHFKQQKRSSKQFGIFLL